MITILGIDPGTAVTGYGVVVRKEGGAVSLLECGVIRTDAGAPLPERLLVLHDGVTGIMARHRPSMAAVESVFFARNARSTVVLSESRGAILVALAKGGLAVAEYAPADIKRSVASHGRATKEQIQFMVMRLLGLKEPPQPADAADAVAVALCHAFASHLPRHAVPRDKGATVGKDPLDAVRARARDDRVRSDALIAAAAARGVRR